MKKTVIVTDWAGVLAGAMSPVIVFALSCLKKHLGVALSKGELKEKMVIFRQFPFRVALKMVFSQADERLINACADEFEANLIAVVGPKVETIAGVKETLRNLDVLDKIESLKVIILSAAPLKLVEWWAREKGLMPYITEICCIEGGDKQQHLRKIRENYPGWEIIFISDEPGEMNLVKMNPDDISIGVALPGQEEKYFDSGADKVIYSFQEILEIDIGAI